MTYDNEDRLKDLAGFGCCILLIITSPITLPIIGIYYIGHKINKKIQKIKSNKTYEIIKTYLSKDDDVDKTWKNEHIIIGFNIRNTRFIIIDYNVTDESVCIEQIEKYWIPGRNFIFAYINQDNFKNEDLQKLLAYNYTSDSNTIKFFNFINSKNKINKIQNIENRIIHSHFYYGILGKMVKCEYY
jgi:hypothetical protein